jgi:SAM-dependent methyltransferase
MAPVQFPPGFFDRVEVRGGAAQMDDAAVAAIRDLYGDLGVDGRVLDLCGHGLDDFDVPPDDLVVLDRDDLDGTLAYGDDAFDDVVCADGVGTLTRPDATFAEVARVLRPGGRLVCTFSSEYLSRSAIRGWISTDDAGRMRIVRAYFGLAPAFGPAESDLRTSLTGTGDRLWAVWAATRR